MNRISLLLGFLFITFNASAQPYKIVDTGQSDCYNELFSIAAPAPGAAYYGQDAQHAGNQPTYQDNGDGTVTDLVTGLMWQKNLYPDKYTFDEALAGADTCTVGGYDDWRLPTIKEMYSLILFTGLTSVNAQSSIPFLDTNYFEFRYGDETIERFIDAQYITNTVYTGGTIGGAETAFGVNFADGRIKGYPIGVTPMGEKLFEVRYVRGNTGYGINDFADNGDGTITDQATGLMWTKEDSGGGMTWEEALVWVQARNAENYLGHDDWRLPNAKELQSIVDYTRSPQATNSPALDPLFESSAITDEGDGLNYPFCWTSTTHGDGGPGMEYHKAVYVCFGEALGFMEMPPNSGNYILMDVHGAGAQRSDPKNGDPDDFPYGFGPQGDVIRIFNYVRMVRDDDNTTGLNEIKEENGLELFPNPASSQLCVRWTGDQVELRLFDNAGRQMTSDLLIKGENAIDVSSFPPGLYFVSVKAGQTTISERIVIAR